MPETRRLAPVAVPAQEGRRSGFSRELAFDRACASKERV
jgi:hypothetical protein